MKCPKCGSENVTVQMVTEVKTKKHGILYWLIIGWWFELLMWIFLTLPMLIVKLFGHKKTTSKSHSEGVCQNCGYHWKI